MSKIFIPVVFFLLPEIQTGVPKPHIGKIIFQRGIDILFPFDIVSERFVHNESINEIIKIFFNRGGTDGGLFHAFEGIRKFFAANCIFIMRDDRMSIRHQE